LANAESLLIYLRDANLFDGHPSSLDCLDVNKNHIYNLSQNFKINPKTISKDEILSFQFYVLK